MITMVSPRRDIPPGRENFFFTDVLFQGGTHPLNYEYGMFMQAPQEAGCEIAAL